MEFIDAVIANDEKEVERHLREGISPNMKLDDDNITPLHFAAQNNACKVIPLLIKAGADLNARATHDGSTPLDIAILFGHEQAATLLQYYMEMHSETRH